MSKRQVTFYVDSDIFDRFRKLYPNIASVFFRRVVLRCIRDKDFFQDVFFNTPDDPESTNF